MGAQNLCGKATQTMSENIVVRDIQAKLSNNEVRLWRNNCGNGWLGNATVLENGDVLLRNPRRIQFGLAAGSSDIVGCISKIITLDMVGQKFAQLVSIEGKSKTGRLRDEQALWLDCMRSLGALHGVARSVEDARRILQGFRPSAA
jgi:hypothetical protein